MMLLGSHEVECSKFIHHCCTNLRVREFEGMLVAFDGDANIYTPRRLIADDFDFSAEVPLDPFVGLHQMNWS